MTENKYCDKKEHDITDFSKCTEHPFTMIVKIMECASKLKQEYKVKVPLGTIPINILTEYSLKLNVEFDTKEENGVAVFIFKPTS